MWKRRKRRQHLAPPPPDPHRLERARQEAQRAHQQLDNARAQDEEVTERSEHLEEVLVNNNLGPKFWAAVAARRAAP